MPSSPNQPTRKVLCIGWGDREGVCENEAGTTWTRLWCSDCDERRRAHITAEMEKVTAAFEAQERES